MTDTLQVESGMPDNSLDHWQGTVDTRLDVIGGELNRLATHMDRLTSNILEEKRRAHEGFDVRIRNLEYWQRSVVGMTLAGVAIIEFVSRFFTK